MTHVSIEVIPSQIRKTADNLLEAAEGVKRANPSDSLDAFAGALPGSQSAGAAKGLANAWNERFRTWFNDADHQHEAQYNAARNYDDADYAADRAARNAALHTGMIPTPTSR